MASGTGTATLDFSTGANEASVALADAAISITSKVEAYFMADDTTADHTAKDHRYAAALIGLTCGTPVAGVGATIYGYSLQSMSGTFKVRWVWAD